MARNIRSKASIPTTFVVPTFPQNLSVASGSAFSQSLNALDGKGNALSHSWAKVGGLDAALFTVGGGNLTMTAKNKLSPTDSNGDNVYEVLLEATEPKFGFKSIYPVKVTVT